jgi:hypothetical protein
VLERAWLNHVRALAIIRACYTFIQAVEGFSVDIWACLAPRLWVGLWVFGSASLCVA